MSRLIALIAVALLSSPSFAGLVTYTANGGTGFGGAIGGSSMTWSDDGLNITVNFTKGAGGFNDIFVLYLDTNGTGRSTIGPEVNDRQDQHRSAISYMEASTGRALTFPSSFRASHAVAINASFNGLWSIPATGSVGNNGLGFISTVNSTLSSNNQSNFSFSIPLASLGISPFSGSTIRFVGTYLNPYGGESGRGFASNEGYGAGFPGGNIGQESFTFTGSPLTYVTAVPEPSSVIFMTICASAGAHSLFKRHRRKQAIAKASQT